MKNASLFKAISDFSGEWSRNQKSLSIQEAETLVNNINELFKPDKSPLTIDEDKLKVVLEAAVQNYITDKNNTSKAANWIVDNPFDYYFETDEWDKLIDEYEKSEDLKSVIELIDQLDVGSALYAFRLKGDLFVDLSHFSNRTFLYKLWFKLKDDYICRIKDSSHEYDESFRTFYEELAIVLEIVFKEYVGEVVALEDVEEGAWEEVDETVNIYTLYKEIAKEFADGDESHLGIYHALYAIAYITEKMSLDELINIVGDHNQKDSEINKRILTACENIRMFAKQNGINHRAVLKVYPNYRKELNEDSGDEILLSRKLLSDIEKTTAIQFVDKDNAWKARSMYRVLEADEWKSTWSSISAELRLVKDSHVPLPEENMTGLPDARFWIEALMVMKLFAKNSKENGVFTGKLYRPLEQVIHYPAPNFSPLEEKKGKKVIFTDPIGMGEENHKSLTRGFTDENGKVFEKITGQDRAVRKFIDAYEDALLFNNNPNRPKAVYLFVGPPGVGKTMLAENFAALSGRPFKRFDMSEYTGNRQSAEGLIGFESTYINSQPGVLTEYVEKNPYAVILFDEIEKASKEVHRIFLSVLEGARLTDKFTGKAVSFSETILIFTTNAGKDLYEDNEDMDLSTISDSAVIKALRGTEFPPELVSRFASNNIIVFNHLDKIALKNIAESGFNAIKQSCLNSEEGFDIDLSDENLSTAYMFSQSKLDARIISSGSRKFLGGIVRDAIKPYKPFGGEAKETEVHLTKAGAKGLKIKISVDVDNVKDKSIKDLFLPVNDEELTESNVVRALYVTDHKDQDINPTWLKKERVCSFEEFRQKVDESRDPYDMYIIDLSTGGNTYLYNSSAEGVKVIDELSDTPGNQIVCVVEGKGIELTELDKESLINRGVSCFLSENESGESWKRTVCDAYIKRSLRLLADEGYVLGFDTDIKMENKAEETAEKTVRVSLTNLRYIEAEVEDAGTRRKDLQTLVSESERPKVKFDDIIGADSAKHQLQDIIAYVNNPAKYEIMNCPAPRGLLLHGLPGTGKTMLAKALAGETKMAFIATTGSELATKGAEGVEYVFDLARRKRKAIIFIDEFDALGSTRTGIQTYKEFAVNRLLTEMDGFSADKKRLIFVIAATNAAYEDRDFGIDVKIDEAVARRFGKSLVIELPSKEARIEYIKKRLNEMNQKLEDEVIEVAADLTIGRSLAVIESYLQNCIRHAIRDSKDSEEKVLMYRDRFLNYLQEELFGDSNEEGRSGMDDTKTREITKTEDPSYHVAIHEAGHALLSCITGNEPAILTISGRGHYAGFYLPAEKQDNKIPTKREKLNDIDISLAGGIAETVIFGEEEGTTIGVSSDLEKATYIARMIITKWGMTDNIAVIRNDRLIDRAIGDTTLSKEILDGINAILRQEKEHTCDLIEKNKNVLVELADAVYESKGKFLTGEEIKAICDKAVQ
ncbi:ATP-dependent Zn proteases [Lachnospiraceae bacterium XBB2008]|nr:ATP-dependent Zn proteases [Lachnospiraceae bacterium XBB2008]